MNRSTKLPPDLIDKPIVDMGDLVRVIPYSPSGIRALVKKGKLPAPFRLCGKDVWDFEPILQTIENAASYSKAS